MSGARIFASCAALAVATTVADARVVTDLQCVPYARQVSGIRIYGDAHTWWEQARGRYARGAEPKVGSVMAFRPHGNSRLGHVAAVSRIVDERTVLIKHANWSEPGRIENDVRAVDVSSEGDWSQVRVWYAPARSLGGTRWPLRGFIYNEPPRKAGKPAKSRPGTGRPPERETRDPVPSVGRSDPIGDIIAASRAAARRGPSPAPGRVKSRPAR